MCGEGGGHERRAAEGWNDIQFAAIDANGIDMAPIRDNNLVWGYFFILFMIIGAFFIMNLFVGVIIDNFNRLREELGEHALLTSAQREWVKTQEVMLHVRAEKRPQQPKTAWRLLAWKLCQVRAEFASRVDRWPAHVGARADSQIRFNHSRYHMPQRRGHGLSVLWGQL